MNSCLFISSHLRHRFLAFDSNESPWFSHAESGDFFGTHVGEDLLHTSGELSGALVFACNSNNGASWESGEVFLETVVGFTVGVVSFASNGLP